MLILELVNRASRNEEFEECQPTTCQLLSELSVEMKASQFCPHFITHPKLFTYSRNLAARSKQKVVYHSFYMKRFNIQKSL